MEAEAKSPRKTKHTHMRSPSTQFSMFLCSMFLFHLPLVLSNPPNSLEVGSSLSVKKTDLLISEDGTFSSGFYEVGKNAYCFAIWFSKSTHRTLAWTANRDHPVNGHGSKLSFMNGNMVLTDFDGSRVWSSEGDSRGASRVELLNSGNLVMKDEGGIILWQSFDSPTDTLLPTQPLTKGKRLVSAIARFTVRSGYYSLFFDNDNILKLLYDCPHISSLYWPDPMRRASQSGRVTYNSSRIAVLDERGVFLSSDGYEAKAADMGVGIKRRLKLDRDGNIRIYSLNESVGQWTMSWIAIPDRCKIHGICGRSGICIPTPQPRCSCPPGYSMTNRSDWREGCKPVYNLSCDHPQQDLQFIRLARTDFYGFDLAVNLSISFESCKHICMRDCHCLAFNYRLTGTGVCYPKIILFNGITSPDVTAIIYLKVPRNIGVPDSNRSIPKCKPMELTVGESGVSPKRTNKPLVYLGAFASAVGAIEIILIATGSWYLSRKNNMLAASEDGGYRMIASYFRRFTFKELKKVTGKFKEHIGRGTSGDVYRGVLEDGRVVAAKKLKDVIQGQEEFWQEMSFLGRMNHMNLVRMRGFCSEGSHRFVVYDYMENGSLDKHIFDSSYTSSCLGWNQRFKIALGTARGLAYLHHECLDWVIHCNIKPENILLDNNFEAKIGDFGLAKLFHRDRSMLGFSKVRGTSGYMAPEWDKNLPITEKVDVYSYGIVLMEIITGSRISIWYGQNEEEDLTSFICNVKDTLNGGQKSCIEDIVDSRLDGEINWKEAAAMLDIAISCVDEDFNKRPTMDTIVELLLECQDGRTTQSDCSDFEEVTS